MFNVLCLMFNVLCSFLLFNVDVVVRMWGEDAKKWEKVMEFAIFLLYLPI